MGNLDYYNDRMVEKYRDNWLNPDYNFFPQQSTILEMEIEKRECEYTLSDEQVKMLREECESDDFTHLDNYDWAELLGEFTGKSIYSDDIVKVDLETNTITYLK